MDIDQFTTRRRSDKRPKPYSRLETDQEVLDRCTELLHKKGGTFKYCIAFSENSHRAQYIAIDRDDVDIFADAEYNVRRRIVWEAP